MNCLGPEICYLFYAEQTLMTLIYCLIMEYGPRPHAVTKTIRDFIKRRSRNIFVENRNNQKKRAA